MKKILVLSTFFCLIVVPALGQLTDTDLDKIQLIVNEAEKRIKEEIKEENRPIKVDIVTLKTDGKVLKTEVTNLKDIVKKDSDSNQKNFDRQNSIIIACIGIPLAIIAISVAVWGILAQKRIRREQILENQIETLTQEIEKLKQQRIVSR